jgi:hypothetical protein
MVAGRNVMEDSIERRRREQLERCLPDIWKNRTVLYIGAYAERFHFKDKLCENRCMVDVLEVEPTNHASLFKFEWLHKIILGDAIYIEKYVDKNYDLVMWSHGIQQIEKKYFKDTIDKLWKITDNILVFLTPWGKYIEQSNSGRNTNLTILYREDFEFLGFKTSTIGPRDVNGSNLLAWKRK